jgi:methyltransferase
LPSWLIARTNTKRLLAPGRPRAWKVALSGDLRGSCRLAHHLVAAGTGRQGVDPFWLAMFVLLLFARIWIIATLGPRWTTRIIVNPGMPLVKEGPYRFLNHPNYWVVIGEIAVLPLVFGLPWVALIFTLLNAAVLWIRVREENRALASSAQDE